MDINWGDEGGGPLPTDKCVHHDKRQAQDVLRLDNNTVVNVCGPCLKRAMASRRIVCKFCGVHVFSLIDTVAILRSEPHKPGCPRRDHD